MSTTSGEGRVTTISGTVSQASPAILCDFAPKQGQVTQGTDGLRVNCYTVCNPATAGSLMIAVTVHGLHTTISDTANYFAVLPGLAQPFQIGDKTNGIGKITAFLLNS